MPLYINLKIVFFLRWINHQSRFSKWIPSKKQIRVATKVIIIIILYFLVITDKITIEKANSWLKLLGWLV